MLTKKSIEGRDQLDYYWFLLPGLILFMLLIILPLIINIGISFTEWSGVRTPKFIGFANYINAFKDKAMHISLYNNLLLVVAMTIIPMIIGIFLAVLLFDFVAKRINNTVANFFRAGFYLPQIITIVASAIAWKWIYQPNWGAINWTLQKLGLSSINWLGDPRTAMPSIMIMMIWFQIGYPLVIFMAALQRIDPQLYEAASIDGADWWKTLFSVTIPQITAEIYVVFITTLIHALKVFGPVYAMTYGGPGQSTYVVGYFAYKNFFEKAEVGYGATISILLSTIVVIITLISVRIQSKMNNT